MKKLFLLFTFLCCAVVASARVWHVTTTGTGTDGSTWATAVSLQYALGNAAVSDEIWVAAGTYKPTSGTDRTISFNIPSNVKVYGGFAGTETAFSQRPATIIGGGINATILSGDIGTTGSNADNTRNIVNLNNSNANTELNGFVIENANFPDGTRGAITATGGGGWVRNCVLRNNNGYAFAAFHYKLGSVGGFENCFIVDNTSPYSAAGIETSVIQVNNCVFANNTTTNEASDLQFINSYSAAINCTFYGTSTGGTCAILVQTPSGIPSLSNCIVWTGQTNSFELRSGINFSTDYCVVKSGKTGAGTWLGNNTITTNPLFVNENDIDGADNLYGTADDGLQILYPSSARNAGINNALTNDIVGTTRPTATTTDIGAYENPTTATITPTVGIAITTGSNPVCTGGSLTFTATPTNGGNNPTYQWTKNNVNISGATNAIYTGTAGTDFVNADEIRCILTSNAPNANPLTATSTGITMNIGSPITLTTVSNQTICLGQTATFSSVVSGGTTNNPDSFSPPDNDPTGVLIPLTITGFGVISANTTIEVGLNINHIWDEDIDLYLIGPGNCGAMELSTDNGAGGDNYINTIFLTGAPISITAGSAPFTGTFAPEKDHTLPATGATGLPASALVGCPVAGVWQLRVIDDDPFFLGNVYDVYLTITNNTGTVTHSISSGQANAGLPVTPVTSGNLNRQATYTVTPTAASTYTYTLAAQQNGCAASTNVNITVSSPATRLYVKSNATGANNGTSWADAYTDLQSALSTTCLANNAEIWVAAGTYKPTSGTDRTISFIIPSNLKLYGGFAGTETALSQRPTNLIGGGVNATILSGDIGIVVDNADNTYNIVKMEGNINTLLDGFIVEEANFISDDRGAINAKANGGGNLNNLIIRNNTGYAFSAFQYTGGAVGSINNCFIINNTGPFSAAGIDNGSNVPISNCVFANNTTTNEATDLQLLNTTSIITNCTFYGTSNNGTATIRVNVNATPTFRNCILWGGNTNSVDVQAGCTLTTDYCTIKGSKTGSGTHTNTNGLTSNPLFINTADLDGADNILGTADDGLALQAGSPSSNTGNNAYAPATDIVGTTRPQESITDMGAYENPAIITVTPTVSIAITTGSNPDCSGSSLTFTATPTDGGSNPTYQWTKNNINISGATNATYTGIAGIDFVSTDVIACTMVSNSPNANPSTATSTGITLTVNALSLTCPANISTNATAACSAVVNFSTPTLSSSCGAAIITQIAGLASGSAFPLGITTNTFEANNNGVITTCSFTVTVNNISTTIAYGSSSYCQPNISTTVTPTITGLAGGTFSSTSGLSINSTSGAVNLFTSIPGTYTINYSDGNCIDTFVTLSITPAISKLYVKANATGANNGSSWSDAYTDLQSALTGCLAANAEIWVAAGTYKPTTGVDRTISFVLPSGVKLYGGFAGTETLLSQRPTHVIGGGVNTTILSGNIGDTGIDTDNSYNVVAAFETAVGTLIDGFIIEKGYANVSNSVLVNDIYKPSSAGAGILLADKSFNAHPTHLEVRHCWIRDNKSISNGTAMRFYAAALTSDYGVSVKACVFTDNEGLQGSSAGFSFDGSNGKVNIVVENSLFLRQTSSNYSIFNINDGGNNTGMTVKFFNNTFTNNTSGNSYNALGIINCYQATTNIRFSNNIMWGNNYDQSYSNIQMIRNNSSNASITVTNNLIEDGYAGGGTVANNLDTNPFFINADDPDGTDNLWGTSDDGLALQVSSPARNTGTNSDAPATDIVGTIRPVDGIVDRGAYEATCTPLTPSVTIAITTGTNPTYAGNSITFTATPTNGGGNPSYVWKKNNGIISGIMGNTYTTTTLTNGDKIKVEMTSNEPCALPNMATSNEITICILPAASSVTGGGAYCTGGTGVTVGLSNSETGVSYQLRKDNVDDGIAVAGTGTAISFGAKTAIGTYTVVATRTLGGCTNNMTGSTTITVNAPPLLGSTPASLCTGQTFPLSPGMDGAWQSSNASIAGVTPAGLVTALMAGTVYFTFTSGITSCSARTADVVIKQTPSSLLKAGKYDVCPNTEVTLNPNCSIPTSTVNWNPGAPTVTPDAATIPYVYRARCVADGCVGNETEVTVRTHRILVDMKDLDVGVLPLPIVRAVKDNMAPTNQINAPEFPRRWTFIATGCNASESAEFRLSGPVIFNSIDNAATYAMFANDAGGFYSIDHPNYGIGTLGFPNGTYSLTINLRSEDGVGGPFPKNRVPKSGGLLATRTLEFTVGGPQFAVGSRQSAVVGSEQFTVGSEQSAGSSGQWTEISPNPVSNTMRLKVTEAKGQMVSVTMMDAVGRTVLKRTFVPETHQHQEEFEVNHLANGMYFIGIGTDKKQAVHKILKTE